MLLANKKYDPVLLSLSQWICRRWYVMGAYRKYKERYQISPHSPSRTLSEIQQSSSLPNPLLLALTDPIQSSSSSPSSPSLFVSPISPIKEQHNTIERVFEFLVELIGTCPRGFRNIITYI